MCSVVACSERRESCKLRFAVRIRGKSQPKHPVEITTIVCQRKEMVETSLPFSMDQCQIVPDKYAIVWISGIIDRKAESG
jgi:hypothetical protein